MLWAAYALLVVSYLLSLITVRRLRRNIRSYQDAVRATSCCVSCGGPHAGFIHEPDCPGPIQRVSVKYTDRHK